MSTEIDSKVVEMRFDNRHFEQNVATSMSTIDKLKSKLHFSDASKGLDNLGKSAKNVDMSHLSNAVETVRTRFSAMEVVGVTALANITNSAVNAGKRMLAALTIDPVKTGFSEYELKMDSVKTIMASTGESVKTVNKYLEELNEYSDQTIYSFSDMTQNIGKFTNAGVKLEDAVMAIKGISNEAALSGANANEASRAMYNFAQALSSGAVKLIDWKSIENANMATVEFKQQLIDSAVAMGTVTKSADGMYTTLKGNTFSATKGFNDVLQDQWMTSEVLVETLKDYADETTDIGKKAKAAAQDVTKLSQVFDIAKETAQSGWAKTWELIFGDIEEAKKVFTRLSNFINGIIDGISDFRNNLLEGALGNPFQDLFDKFEASGLLRFSESVGESVDGVTESLEYFQKVVNDVWRGDYKNAPVRYDLLDEAGYNHKVVQDLVNKGYQYKLTMEDVIASHEKFGLAVSENSESVVDMGEALKQLSDEQLKEMGFTEDQIKLLRELAEEAEKSGVSLNELLDAMSSGKDGRTLLIESFANAGKGLIGVFTALKDAWVDIFPPMTSMQLYNIISGMNELSKHLVMSEDTVDKLTRTFKGLFAALDIVLTIIGGPIRLAFTLFKQLLGAFNLDILSFTALMGDAIVKFRDWIDAHNIFTFIFEKIIPALKELGAGIRDWVQGLKETENVPKYIIMGLVNGLANGASAVWNAMVSLGKKIIDAICGVLGIHSPSTKFIEIGKNIIEGLVKGIQMGAHAVWELIKSIGLRCYEIIKNLDIGTVIATAISVGGVMAVKKSFDLVSMIASPLEGLGDIFEGLSDTFTGLGKALTGLGKSFKADALLKKSKALINFAIAIGILAGVLYLITKIDTDRLWESVGVLAALAGIITLLSIAVSKFSTGGSLTISIKSFLSLIGLSAALLMVAIALKKVASIEGDIGKAIGVIITIEAIFAALIIVSKFAGENAKSAGSMLLKMSIALLLMLQIVKIAAKLDPGVVDKGIATIAKVELLFAGIIIASKFAGEHAKSAGSMLLKMSLAMFIVVQVIKQIAGIEQSDIDKGIKTMQRIGLLMGAFVLLSGIASKGTVLEKGQKYKGGGSIGSMLLMLAGAFAILVLVMKMVSDMDVDDLKKGYQVLTALGILCGALVVVSKFSGTNAAKAGAMILTITIAMGLLTALMYVIGKMDPDGVKQGLAVIAVMEILFMGLIAVTKNAKSCKDELLVMIAVIGMLSLCMFALSGLNPDRLKGATAAITLVIGAFAALVASTKFAKNSKSMRKTLLELAAVAVLMTALIAVLANVADADKALKSSAALSLLLTAFSTSMVLLGHTGRISTTVQKNLAPFTAVVLGLAVILGAMSALGVEASIPSAIALGVLLNALATSMLILDKVKKLPKGIETNMMLMGVVVLELAVILGGLSALGVEASIPSAIALGILLNALASSMLILDQVKHISTGTVGVAILMGLVVAELAVILGYMNEIGVEASIPSALALGVLLNALASSMLILDQVQHISAGTVAVAVVMGLVVAELASILGYMDKHDYEGSIPTAISLGILINALSLACVILSGVGKMGMVGLKGVLILEALIIATGLVMVAIGSLVDLVPDCETFLNTGVKVLTAVGEALGGFIGGLVGNLVGGVMDGVINTLPNLGKKLSEFYDIVKDFDAGEMEGVSDLIDVLFKLTAAEFLDTINIFSDNSDMLTKFGAQLKPFGEQLVEFSNVVKDNIDEDAVQAAANAGKMMTSMAESIPNTGGMLADLLGDNTMDTFGEDLVKFGESIVAFSEVVSAEGAIDEDAVEAAANAGKIMAAMAESIPNTGGVLADFLGDNNIADFGADLEAFGTSIVNFSSTVDGNISTTAVESAAAAGELLTALAESVPNTGGIVSWFTGDNNIADFGADLESFATSMCDMSKTLVENPIDTEAVETIASMGSLLSALAESLPKDDGGSLAKLFVDDVTTLEEFGGQAAAFAKSMAQFCDSIDDVTVNETQVNSIISATKGLIEISKTLPKDDGGFFGKLFVDDVTTLQEFGNQAAAFGKSMNQFAAAVGKDNVDINKAKTATETALWLADVAKNAPSDLTNFKNFGAALKDFAGHLNSYATETALIDQNGLNKSRAVLNQLLDIQSMSFDTAKLDALASSIYNVIDAIKYISTAGVSQYAADGLIGALESLASTDIDAVVTAFSGGDEKLYNAGANIVSSFLDGIDSMQFPVQLKAESLISDFAIGVENGEEDATGACEAVLEACEGALEADSDTIESLGKAIVEGFAKGIKDNASIASKAAAKAAADALAAAEEELGVNSPSKEFIKVGKYVIEGFAKGILGDDRAEKASAEKAEAVIDSARESLDINSPSGEFEEIGHLSVEGFVLGIMSNTDDIEAAADKGKLTAEAYMSSFEDEYNNRRVRLNLGALLTDGNQIDKSIVDLSHHTLSPNTRTAIDQRYFYAPGTSELHQKFANKLQSYDGPFADAIKNLAIEFQDGASSDNIAKAIVEGIDKVLSPYMAEADGKVGAAWLNQRTIDAAIEAGSWGTDLTNIKSMMKTSEVWSSEMIPMYEARLSAIATLLGTENQFFQQAYDELQKATIMWDYFKNDEMRFSGDSESDYRPEGSNLPPAREYGTWKEYFDNYDIGDIGLFDPWEKYGKVEMKVDENGVVKYLTKLDEEADTIADKYQKAFEAIDLDIETVKLEKENGLITESEAFTKELELANSKVEVAKKKWEETAKSVGSAITNSNGYVWNAVLGWVQEIKDPETGEVTGHMKKPILPKDEEGNLSEVEEITDETVQQAYNEYLQAMIDANAVVTEMNSKSVEAIDNEIEALDLDIETINLEKEKGLISEADAIAKEAELINNKTELARQKWEKMKTLNVSDPNSFTGEDVQQAYNDYIQNQIDADTKAAEAKSALDKMTFEESMKWIEEKKKANDLSLIAELAAYKRVSARYEEGSEQRIEAEEKVAEVREKITKASEDYYKKLDELNTEYSDKRIELEEKYLEQAKYVQDEYAEKLASRKDLIGGAYGLFDEVSEQEEVKGSDLTQNLRDQLDSINEWRYNVESLKGRGLNAELLSELEGMGIDSAAQIEAIAKMTDAELAEYSRLWEAKNRTTNVLAENELKADKDYMESVLAGLEWDLTKDLSDLEDEYKPKFEALEATFINALNGVEEDTRDIFTKTVDGVIDLVGEQTQWSELGGDIIYGLIDGINIHSAELFANMTEIMKGLDDTARSAVDSHSPSRKFAEIGRDIDAGLIVGLRKFSGGVNSAVENIGRSAIDAMRNSMRHLPGIINGDVSMSPSIRPVFDLSDVRSDARTIGSMLRMGNSIGVNSNLGAIATMIGENNQNGETGELVSAINKLRSDLGNIGNTTYQVNGITYDDGSNVSNAVKSLIRAAKVERRK